MFQCLNLLRKQRYTNTDAYLLNGNLHDTEGYLIGRPEKVKFKATRGPNKTSIAEEPMYNQNVKSCKKNCMVNYKKDLQNLKECRRKVQEAELPKDHADIAHIYCNIGLVYRKQDCYNEVLEFYQKAKIIQEKSLPNHPDLARTYFQIGCVYKEQGDIDEAMAYHEM